jgi:hypothetical protein
VGTPQVTPIKYSQNTTSQPRSRAISGKLLRKSDNEMKTRNKRRDIG